MGSQDTVLLEEMAWPEVADKVRLGRIVVVFACGAVEQHGPHLPLGTDAYLGTAIAEAAARKAGNALVAPTVRPGLSQHHMHFPASMSLRVETFLALITDYCASLSQHGFRRIVMFSSHGGNVDVLRAHLPELARTFQDRTEIRMAIRTSEENRLQRELWARHGVTLGQAGFHAGRTETSSMVAHRPDLVRMDKAEPGYDPDDFYQPDALAASQLELYLRGVDALSANGVMGNPLGATEALGRELIESNANYVLRELTAPFPAA